MREVSDEFLVEEEDTSSNDADPPPEKRLRRGAAAKASAQSKVPTSPSASKSVTAQQVSQVIGSENRSPQAVTRPIFQPHASPSSYSTHSSSLMSPGSSPVLQKRARPKSSPLTQPPSQGFHKVVSQPQLHQGGYQNPQPPAGSTSNNSNFFHIFSLTFTSH